DQLAHPARQRPAQRPGQSPVPVAAQPVLPQYSAGLTYLENVEATFKPFAGRWLVLDAPVEVRARHRSIGGVAEGAEDGVGQSSGVARGKRLAHQDGVHEQRAGNEVEGDLDVGAGRELVTVDGAAHDGAGVLAGGAGNLLKRPDQIR